MRDSILDKAIDDLWAIETTSRWAENSTTKTLNLLDIFYVQRNPIVLVESSVSVFNPEDLPDTIVVVQTHEDLPDNDI